MKKQFVFAFILSVLAATSFAQLSVYVKLTAMDGRTLTTAGTFETSIPISGTTIEAKSNQLIKVSAYESDVANVLSLSSQSTGAGVGKVTFNPLSITKTMDAMSPILFQNCASGAVYKTAEVFFVSGDNTIMIKHTFQLVQVKTVAWSAACTAGCAAINEVVTFETGGQVITVNGKTGQVQAGWNRMRNVMNNDPAATISQ